MEEKDKKEDKQQKPKTQEEDLTSGLTWKIMLLFAVINLGYQFYIAIENSQQIEPVDPKMEGHAKLDLKDLD